MTIDIKVQPKSRRPGVQGHIRGVAGPRLRIGVSEAAEAGRANRAVCSTLATLLSIPASAVTVLLGQASREKTVHIADLSPDLITRLEQL